MTSASNVPSDTCFTLLIENLRFFNAAVSPNHPGRGSDSAGLRGLQTGMLAMPPVHSSREAPMAPALVRQPIYQQLNEALRGLVSSGEFKTGVRFLSEREV